MRPNPSVFWHARGSLTKHSTGVVDGACRKWNMDAQAIVALFANVTLLDRNSTEKRLKPCWYGSVSESIYCVIAFPKVMNWQQHANL